MANPVQIFLCYLTVLQLNLVSGKPFGEIYFKNNFDVAFKPLPFKPIAFIKEKWSPFGVFGTKHGIAKRDLDNIKTIEAKKDEKLLTRLPAEVYEIETSPGVVTSPIIPVAPAPILAPPIGPVVLITPPPKLKGTPNKDLRTNIYNNELISGYLKSVERPIYSEEKVLPPPLGNNIIPEKPVEKEQPSPLLKGSRLALYFGNILLEVLAQFLGGPHTEQQAAI